jgi:hypothetical protein
MKSIVWWMMTVALMGCGSSAPTDEAAKFVGSWAYASGAKVEVTCGPMTFPVALDTVVETFVESGGMLVKTDSQGCAGLEFTASGEVATLGAGMQSCMIPASGMNPAATFSPTSYAFTMSADEKTLSAKVAASYTPMGQSACSVAGTNTLTRK